jgi:hypothetical protein
VSQVGIAGCASHLDPLLPVGIIRQFVQQVGGDGAGKAGPAAA